MLMCPSCGKSLDERFCDVCGVPGEEEKKEGGGKKEEGGELREEGGKQKPEGGGRREVSASQCGDFRVLCDVGGIFVETLTVPVRFRITPLVDDVADLQLLLSVQHRSLRPMHLVVEEYLTPNWEQHHNFDVTVPRGCAGHVTLKVYMAYRKGGEVFCFSHTLADGFRVFGMNENAMSAINLVINQNQQHDIKAGNASDVLVNPAQYDNRLGELKELAAQAQARSAVDVLAGITLDPVWYELAWTRCKLPGEMKASFPAQTRRGPGVPHASETGFHRLTLWPPQANRLHLWRVRQGEVLTLGRNRDCDICTRVMDAHGQVDKQASMLVSGVHARLGFQAGPVQVQDGGPAKPSAHGLLLDGHPVSDGHAAMLPLNREAPLALGAAPDKRSVEFVVYGWTVGGLRRAAPLLPMPEGAADEELACLHLKNRSRGDDYLFIVHGCAGKTFGLPPGLGGLIVRYDGLSLCVGDDFTWLCPDASLPRLPGWRITDYEPAFA